MKIRSITCFYDPRAENAGATLDRLGLFCARARVLIEEEGFPVQSSRLASIPFPEMCPSGCHNSGISLSQNLEQKAADRGFEYFSMGPASAGNPESYGMIPEMLKETRSVFFGANLLDARGEISLKSIHSTAEIILQAAGIEKDGFTNLRFAALANVKPFTPFFPAAFSAGHEAAFSLAMECADIFVSRFGEAGSLKEAHDLALGYLEESGRILKRICARLEKEFNIRFKGIDFSSAPYPGETCSIGKALESLGIPALGKGGSAAVMAFLAGLLEEGRWEKAGFNGLMLPVLEDSFLALRAAEGNLTIHDLLLYSCLCGTGLDTVPLAGDVTVEQIEGVLLDLAAISVRLSKPLTARLMPIPGKKAGDEVNFNFEYFARGKVMALDSTELKRFFREEEPLKIHPRKI